MVGAMLGVFPRTDAVEVAESGVLPELRVQRKRRDGKTYEHVFPEFEGVIGFRAHVSLVTRDGGVVGGAEALCSRREEKWRDREDNQIASMAQTRATAKAFRLSFGFIMPMSGYAPTPAEEMEGVVEVQFERPSKESIRVGLVEAIDAAGIAHAAVPRGLPDYYEWLVAHDLDYAGYLKLIQDAIAAKAGTQEAMV